MDEPELPVSIAQYWYPLNKLCVVAGRSSTAATTQLPPIYFLIHQLGNPTKYIAGKLLVWRDPAVIKQVAVADDNHPS